MQIYSMCAFQGIKIENLINDRVPKLGRYHERENNFSYNVGGKESNSDRNLWPDDPKSPGSPYIFYG